uniref:Uncharacterized protein n=1 Tax=Heterorhabditis bacteriophora TaxID=37862 RepID=A0A1I7WND9_HETBA
MIDRKLSIFTRKKSSPNADKNGGIAGNHANTLKEITRKRAVTRRISNCPQKRVSVFVIGSYPSDLDPLKLKSSNCVVDSRFVLKVSSFNTKPKFYIRKCWKKCIVVLNFSAEISLLKISEIVQRVKKHVTNGEEALRPFVPDSIDAEDEINQSLVELMRCSWAEDIHGRPNISLIRNAVRMLNNESATQSDFSLNLLLEHKGCGTSSMPLSIACMKCQQAISASKTALVR